MEYRRLGKSGVKVSQLSFGSWVTFGKQLDMKEATKSLSVARDYGVNFFDNAEVYAAGQSEEIMGSALKELNWPRLSYLISTKFFWGITDDPNGVRMRFALPTKSPSVIICTNRWSSNRSTICSIGKKSTKTTNVSLRISDSG